MELGQRHVWAPVHAHVAMSTSKDVLDSASPWGLCAAPCLARPRQSGEASSCRPTHEPVAHHALNQ